jgi:NAD(P)-dependent dehydrogenase (short-subunit alcohol dehydrogenase family)
MTETTAATRPSPPTPPSASIALVTGANKGIGREIAAQLADRGMTVLLGSRDPDRGAAAAAALQPAHGDVRPLQLDVTDPVSVRAAADRIGAEFGRLDVLVNNAAVSGGYEQAVGTVDVDVVRAVFETNVFGVLRVTDAMLPLLERSEAPRIVNMTSSVGSLTQMADPDGPLAEMPASVAYVPSKTALNSLTVQYAKGLRKAGILVNSGCPGYCATDLNDHRGHRTAAQGAAIAVRLATLGPDGPTGGFFDDAGPVAW